MFFIAPSVYDGINSNNMSMDDAKTKEKFVGAINMEKGIYDQECRFFAPYYRQIGIKTYTLPEDECENSLKNAFLDIKEAFMYYLNNENNNRPIIIAGFSQGADLSIRLLKECFNKEEINKLLVACYAIGWRITEQEIIDNPHLKFASSETDTGVIISFNSEAENINNSLAIPNGTKALAINPLNWKTDSSLADKSLNKGACFTKYDGSIKTEINNLTGCYIDINRGSLKVIDVTKEEYPAGIYIVNDGEFHLYDYQFFYRNLQENVSKRINAFLLNIN